MILINKLHKQAMQLVVRDTGLFTRLAIIAQMNRTSGPAVDVPSPFEFESQKLPLDIPAQFGHASCGVQQKSTQPANRLAELRPSERMSAKFRTRIR